MALELRLVKTATDSRTVRRLVPLLCRAMSRAREFALAAYPEWSWRPQVIGALTLVYLLGVVLNRKADRADPVVDAYWKLLEKRSAWMPG